MNSLRKDQRRTLYREMFLQKDLSAEEKLYPSTSDEKLGYRINFEDVSFADMGKLEGCVKGLLSKIQSKVSEKWGTLDEKEKELNAWREEMAEA